jgi:hypothetical protein
MISSRQSPMPSTTTRTRPSIRWIAGSSRPSVLQFPPGVLPSRPGRRRGSMSGDTSMLGGLRFHGNPAGEFHTGAVAF